MEVLTKVFPIAIALLRYCLSILSTPPAAINLVQVIPLKYAAVKVLGGYIGCFDGVVEDTLLDLLGPIVNAGESASLEQCRSKCSGELFVNVGYFAIQRSDSSGSPGARCACGKELNPERYEAADSRCTAPCPSGGGFCGNPTNGVNVYSQSAAPFVAASRSCTSLVTTSTTTPAELIGTETATSTTTTTVGQPAVTSTCATSTATATQASTVTASTTVTVAKPKTSTCYKTITRTITSTCRPPPRRDTLGIAIMSRFLHAKTLTSEHAR
ncbi:unnamed protein product [Cercospora beticola]|nr:unnamed protein product [Cercospora beticola]